MKTNKYDLFQFKSNDILQWLLHIYILNHLLTLTNLIFIPFLTSFDIIDLKII